MEVMEGCLNENFGANHSSDKALPRWRKVCGVVTNPKWRFRFTANLSKRSEAVAMRQANQVAKESADVIILDDNLSTILIMAKWGRSVYINIKNFVQFQLLVNVVALIVNFSSAWLTGNAPLTAVVLLTLEAFAKRTMAKQLFSFFILLVIVFLLEIQAVDGGRAFEECFRC